MAWGGRWAAIFVLMALPVLARHEACPSIDGSCDNVPTLSIIYITKRPGGYDVLFECLSKQTSRDFELICVDDIVDRDRHDSASDYALRKGIPLVAMVSSKEKVRGKRFGQCNAINSGLALSRGDFITVVQDNVWLPPTFVERTIAFYRDHGRDVLLSYPERRIYPPKGRLSKELMNNRTTLSVFDPPVTESPESSGWEVINFNNTMPFEVFGHIGEGRALKTEWFECAACTASWELYAALNGLDEVLDAGDDAQEANVKDRAAIVGQRQAKEGQGADGHGMGQLWVDLGTVVQLIDHHSFEADETWARFERDTNVHRWRATMDIMELGEYPLEAPNAFSLSQVRGEGGRRWREAVRDGQRRDGVLIGVDWGQLPPRGLSAFDQGQVDLVLQPRFGYKPDILVAHAMPPEVFDEWHDALRRAFRLMRRHFHLTFMYVGYIRVEEQPDINYLMKHTHHFILGIGSFFGPVDYFIRQYDLKINPQLLSEGKQKVRMGMIMLQDQEVPDGDGVDVYEVVIYASRHRADRASSLEPSLNVHHAHGVSATFQAECAASRPRSGTLAVGDLSSGARMELVLGKIGPRRVIGRMTHGEMSADIRDELRRDGVEVSDWVGEEERRDAYCAAELVYFPMAGEGGGWMELLEVMSLGVDFELEPDNEVLEKLREEAVTGGIPDEVGYANALVAALWTVLIKGASK